jgi:hypothetical protein
VRVLGGIQTTGSAVPVDRVRGPLCTPELLSVSTARGALDGTG